jgi:large subunit ribosomal protein L24
MKKILVLNINTYKKHIKKNEKLPQGGRVDLPRPIDVSKVMLICSKCGKTTRVGYLIEKSKKYRICKKCGSKI